jgi:LemA protein
MAASRNSKILLALVAVIVLAGVWMYTTYNGLVTADENVNTAWRQVEAQYQRRFDLVPNLVNTVKGSAGFEQETLTAITQARTQWQSATQAGDREQGVQAASALDRLLVTVESYPTLNSTQAFQDLMVQLEGTENRIAVARMDYNEAIRPYNLLVRRFPGNILAGIYGFEAEEGFQSAAGSDTAPDVDFGE